MSTENLNYTEITNSLNLSNDITIGSRAWFRAIQDHGYKFLYRWKSSSNKWVYFSKSRIDAENGAIEIVSKQKNMSIELAANYYSEYVDVFSIQEAINKI